MKYQLFLIAIVSAISTSAFAQTKTSAIVNSPPTSKTPDTPRESDGNLTYALGVGDQFIARAPHVPELSDKTFRVGPDGYVNFPMIGNVKAADLQVSALESEVIRRFRKYYVMPDVSIMITDYRSQPVSVIGAVVSPGVHQLEGQKTLLEILSSAGGPRPDAGPIVRITRAVRWGDLPLPGARRDAANQDSIGEINLRDLLANNNSSLNIPIYPDDVISIPAGGSIYVVGQVKKAGSFPLGSRTNLSVLEALSLAEGLDIKAAPAKAAILHPLKDGQTKRQPVPINLAKILKGQGPDLMLGPNDVLFVPSSAARSATLKTIDAAIQIGTGLAIFR
ncbi:MAG: polysaccharide biosynthesis/export family protein [Bryobacteraceae bacterium]